MMGPDMFMPMPHRGPLFFPWHRVMVRQFELALQSAAHDPSITVPYWDWNLVGANSPFTDDFLCAYQSSIFPRSWQLGDHL